MCYKTIILLNIFIKYGNVSPLQNKHDYIYYTVSCDILHPKNNMLEEIKKLIYTKYKPEDKIWLFFSLFDGKWKLLVSNGVLTTDKTMEEMINLLYNWILKKQESKAKHVIIDVVNEIVEQKDVAAFLNMDPKTNWVLLAETTWDKTGLILPNTKWITSMKQAIAWIKQKYQLQWDVKKKKKNINELILDR